METLIETIYRLAQGIGDHGFESEAQVASAIEWDFRVHTTTVYKQLGVEAALSQSLKKRRWQAEGR